MNTYVVRAKVPNFPGALYARERTCTVRAVSEDAAWETANTLKWYGLGIRVSVRELS